MRDVAREAGVSIRTVSRVVNNLGEISEDTRQRVLAVIKELGYRPNAVARGLVSGKTSSVAVIIPQITDPFYPEFVHGVEGVAHQEGYGVFLCNSNGDPQQELNYMEELGSRRVDGVILCGSRLDAERLTQVAAHHRVAVVTSRHPQAAATVSIPGRQGLHEITSHLINLGHWAIGHVGRRAPDECERVDGYMEALSDAGIGIDERRISYAGREGIEAGRLAAWLLFERAPELTAVTTYNDLLAIGTLQVCAELGRRVPDDVAVVGFDDLCLAALVTPALTTMRVPRYRLGEMAMALLQKVMASEGTYEEHLSVGLQLVVRDSCGAKLHQDAESETFKKRQKAQDQPGQLRLWEDTPRS
jgi:LacI family transcriptional regulator